MGLYKLRTEFGAHLKILLGIVAAIFVVGAVFSFGPGQFGGPPQPMGFDETIVEVGDLTITRGEFETIYNMTFQQAKDQGVRSPLVWADLRANVLQQLISDRLLLLGAEKMGVDISDEQVDAQMDELVTQELNQLRQTVLGQLSEAKSKQDPRDDDEFRKALAENGMSLDTQIERVETRYPRELIRAQVAKVGLQKKIEDMAGPVTKKDIDESYNEYEMQQILISKGSGLPEEQLENKAKNVASEAKKGTDFTKLAKENSDYPGAKESGGKMSYNFDMRFMVPMEVREELQNMKPGEVSSAIDTPQGYYIVKLLSVTNNKPAKLDKEAREKREEEIRSERLMTQQAKVMKDMLDYSKVKVVDNELKGYWHVFLSYQEPEKRESHLKSAEKAFEKAMKEATGKTLVKAKLADIKMTLGKYDEAIKYARSVDNDVESADVLIMLGDLFLQAKPEDVKQYLVDDNATEEEIKALKDEEVKDMARNRAVQYYNTASDTARQDLQVRQELIGKFQALGMQDKVKQEEQKIQEELERRRIIEEKSRPKSDAKPTPGNDNTQEKPGEGE